MDILREINDEELEFIIEKLKTRMPYKLKNLHYILSAQKCKTSGINNLSDKTLPTFYTHRNGIKKHCTIFGITGERDHTVWYFTFDESLNEIRQCLNNTKFIKWNILSAFLTIHTEQIQPALDFISNKKLKIKQNKQNFYLYLPIEKAHNFDIVIPSETVLEPLKEEDASLCNSLWAFKSDNSEIWVKSLILVHGGYALRRKDTRELLSFGLINDHLAIGMLTTIEKAQRKGYAEIIVKQLVKKLIEINITPIVYVHNPNALKLFQKLGFISISNSNWIFIQK
ncbi:hypothetical protein PVAND_009930 [Polypedilum vanderplanki]|uniref:N-acetyltransferase domain-containing protein n=1 Tax=Polypedilum vanderplanki TaxID=319348 RepID=A0A9J6CFN6_POLVA|nr:hypothetical protein PVAND_009930 [Polypedilum vanderplanki]